MTDLTMSQFASKDDLLAAQAARIAELESQLAAIGAGGVEPLRKPAAAQQEEAIAEIVSASHDQAEFGGRGINFLRDFQHLEYGTKLYPAPQAVQAAVPVAWRLTNTAFRKPRFEYHDTKESAEQRQADFNRSVDDGGLHNLTPLYAAPAHPAESAPAQSYVVDFFKAKGFYPSLAQAFAAGVAFAATQPAAQGMDRQKIDPLRQMLAQHEAHLEQNPYAYFELAYTRRTGWMVWITDKPAFRESVLVNPDRKVLWQGQGDTPDEACENAALAAQAKQGGASNG